MYKFGFIGGTVNEFQKIYYSECKVVILFNNVIVNRLIFNSFKYLSEINIESIIDSINNNEQFLYYANVSIYYDLIINEDYFILQKPKNINNNYQDDGFRSILQTLIIPMNSIDKKTLASLLLKLNEMNNAFTTKNTNKNSV